MDERADRAGRDALAARRFTTMNLLRLAGAVMILGGLVVLNRDFGLPPMIGYALVVFGMVEFFVVPNVLAKRWSTKRGE